MQDSINPSVPYATKASETRGRLVPEAPSAMRTEFQRDRDRIVHSGAFRKLRNKTQVFVENEGDYYRTRLTHTLEVAQIARAVARALGVNEDLTETVALAHDLGHTCFGHSGEKALAEEMKPYGGFSHNEQTFRVLTALERRYIEFDGMNLTWETMEGVVKHNGPLQPEKPENPVPASIAEYNAQFDLELSSFAGPEAQIAALADDIAYNTHDIDDGYRAGFFDFDELKKLPIFGPILEDAERHHPNAERNRIVSATVRQVIGSMVNDLLDTTKSAIMVQKPSSASDIRKAKHQTVRFSFAMKQYEAVIRDFLRTRMYGHPKVLSACEKAECLVHEMFLHLMKKPEDLPEGWFSQLSERRGDEAFRARLIADYIAGMTDRFALAEGKRMFSREIVL